MSRFAKRFFHVLGLSFPSGGCRETDDIFQVFLSPPEAGQNITVHNHTVPNAIPG
jgi:hypothetical protein